jgi:hypothetical protein
MPLCPNPARASCPQINYIPPKRTVVDLSAYGPRDATVVKLPNINVNLSHPIQVLHNDPKVRVVDFSKLQKGPIYEVKLPDLPIKNKVRIDLPQVNVPTVVLPGESGAAARRRGAEGVAGEARSRCPRRRARARVPEAARPGAAASLCGPWLTVRQN